MISILHAALAVFVSLAIGFGAGWHTKGKFFTAEQVTVVKEARVADSVSVATSQDRSLKLSTAIDTSKANTATIRKEITRYAPVKIPASPNAEIGSFGDDAALTVGELRLLNAAVSGTAVQPAGAIDGKEQAPSDVGRAETLDHQLQVIDLYHELAKKHDELVDYALGYQKAQRERLAD